MLMNISVILASTSTSRIEIFSTAHLHFISIPPSYEEDMKWRCAVEKISIREVEVEARMTDMFISISIQKELGGKCVVVLHEWATAKVATFVFLIHSERPVNTVY